jgi:hypothetical protein
MRDGRRSNQVANFVRAEMAVCSACDFEQRVAMLKAELVADNHPAE